MKILNFINILFICLTTNVRVELMLTHIKIYITFKTEGFILYLLIKEICNCCLTMP